MLWNKLLSCRSSPITTFYTFLINRRTFPEAIPPNCCGIALAFCKNTATVASSTDAIYFLNVLTKMMKCHQKWQKDMFNFFSLLWWKRSLQIVWDVNFLFLLFWKEQVKLWQRNLVVFFLQVTEIYSLLINYLKWEANNTEKNVCIPQSASCCHKSAWFPKEKKYFFLKC